MISVVVFDWGDTVMRVLGYDGPMAHWPRVEAMPGVEKALPILSGRYRVALATNAADSGRESVRQALQRVDLDQYFDAVLTARELGARKPSLAFYTAVLCQMECSPERAVMVGDNYLADVSGARHAGLRTIWYNPEALGCPLPRPEHNAEVRDLVNLPAVLGNIA